MQYNAKKVIYHRVVVYEGADFILIIPLHCEEITYYYLAVMGHKSSPATKVIP